jgi:hypothetical protein
MTRGTIIHRGCLATCGQCGKTERLQSDMVLPARDEARRKGWADSRSFGWRCPECVLRYTIKRGVRGKARCTNTPKCDG